jgi:hypothetical protein
VQLSSWLDFYRATLIYKCAGLGVEELSMHPVAASSLSLLGLIRHMTFVEQVWFESTFANFAAPTYYGRDVDPDADFNDLASVPLDKVLANYDAACSRSRELSEGHPLDTMAASQRRGREVDLRWIFIHMIEEYARHCGHADILRELIDGSTGY